MDILVDNLIHQWQEYLTNISSNLMELSDQTEYQLIKQKALDDNVGYTGLTKAKADHIVRSVGKLWEHYAKLTEVVEKAKSIADKHGLLYNAQRDIRELLEKSLIVIDEEHVSISKRNLLDDDTDEKRATPKELLKLMQESFETICRDVTEISNAESELHNRLSRIKKDIDDLNSTAAILRITNIPAFSTDRILAVERDPIQGMHELDKLVYAVEKYRASIKSVQHEYNEVFMQLGKVKSLLSELEEIASKSNLAAEESKKLFNTFVEIRPVVSTEVIGSLKSWLSVLEQKFGEGNLKAVAVGISKLEKECSEKLTAEIKNYEINSRDYNEWMDLKGQLKALIVKIEVLRSRGLTHNTSIDELVERINTALHSLPVNLEECRQLAKKLGSSL